MKTKNKLINLDISSDKDLQHLANQLNIKIDGIIDFKDIKTPISSGTYIILQRIAPGIGHWTCVYNRYYYDSMGNPAPEILNLTKYNDKQYQGTYDDYCGLWCLLWLYSKQHHKPDLMKGYYDLNVEVSLQ